MGFSAGFTPSTWTIRLLSERDIDDCVRLLREAFGTVARDFGLTETLVPTNAAFSTNEGLRRISRGTSSCTGSAPEMHCLAALQFSVPGAAPATSISKNCVSPPDYRTRATVKDFWCMPVNASGKTAAPGHCWE